MTKTELQLALAEATQTNKKAAGAFLNALGAIAYKSVKKQGEFVLPGFGKLVKQKRKARTAFNPQTRQKVKVAAKTVVKFRVAKGAKDAILGVRAPVAASPPKDARVPTGGGVRAKGDSMQTIPDAKPATGRTRKETSRRSGRAQAS